ncbi:MAG TPA: NfeD family protein [Aggregatilineales bacterium]|nr:hypothetical protein [Anaerolineales bacterium]HRE48925.1 NfeD family protein [Aggregatilineales bacterium]
MILQDANLIYMLLIVGLWTAVFSIYTPGTGAGETISFALLGVGIYAFATNPMTNWIAVGMVTAGTLAYLLLPLYRKGLAQLALVGLAVQMAGGLFIFSGSPVSPVLIVFTATVSFALYQWALLPLLNKRLSDPILGDEELLPGSVGRVVAQVTPAGGTVHVRSEQWSAYSDDTIPIGESVVVMRRDGLRLVVARQKDKRDARRTGADGELEN